MTHTPTPWKTKYDDLNKKRDAILRITPLSETDSNNLIAIEQKMRQMEDFRDTACNAHDELVAALRGMIELMDNKPTSYDEDQQISSYRAILAKADAGGAIILSQGMEVTK